MQQMNGLEIMILSQTEKDKYDIAYMQNLKKVIQMNLFTMNIKKWYKWTYLQNRNRLGDLENEYMVSEGRVGGGINWECGIDVHTLLYLK